MDNDGRLEPVTLEAIVLAGGRGTRLRSLVSDVPKPMADINGTPFLTYILERLVRAGVSTTVLSVGYKHKAITAHFGEAYRGMRLVYSVEREPLGTGGALALALAQVRGEAAFALNGDTYFEVPLRELAAHHTAGGCDLTMALKRLRNVERYGTVVVDRGRVVRLEENARRAEGFINGGVYVLRRDLLRDLAPGARFSFEADFLPVHLGEIRVCPYPCEGYFIDIGVPEDYLRAQRELKSV